MRSLTGRLFLTTLLVWLVTMIVVTATQLEWETFRTAARAESTCGDEYRALEPIIQEYEREVERQIQFYLDLGWTQSEAEAATGPVKPQELSNPFRPYNDHCESGAAPASKIVQTARPASARREFDWPTRSWIFATAIPAGAWIVGFALRVIWRKPNLSEH